MTNAKDQTVRGEFERLRFDLSKAFTWDVLVEDARHASVCDHVLTMVKEWIDGTAGLNPRRVEDARRRPVAPDARPGYGLYREAVFHLGAATLFLDLIDVGDAHNADDPAWDEARREAYQHLSEAIASGRDALAQFRRVEWARHN